MPKKNVNEKMGTVLGVEGDEEEEGKTKTVPIPKREPQRTEIDNKALSDMLQRIASRDPDDLKQLTKMPQQLADPIAKGMSYYGSTMKAIEGQCSALVGFYIEKCKLDIARCEKQIGESKDKTDKDKAATSSPSTSIVPTGKWIDRLGDKWFGKPKPKILPELEPFVLDQHLKALKIRLSELEEEKKTLVIIDTSKSYFNVWAFNIFLNWRSLDGDLMGSLVSLADAQIVTQQEENKLDPNRLFLR